ncbi:MAG TPA: hypothetical protein VJB57_01485 [Dehalococcoidia bacterium]|nr:hypothetical protein [Dehalococcoidia bacterium]
MLTFASGLGRRPDLTKEQVFLAFETQFGSRYKVTDYSGFISRDFIILKNQFVGVGVRLDQEGEQAKLVYSAIALTGSPLHWLPFGRLAGVILAPLLGYGLVREIRRFVESYYGSPPSNA